MENLNIENLYYDEEAIEKIKQYEWNMNTISITKFYLDAKYICMFYNLNNWYVYIYNDNIMTNYDNNNIIKLDENNLNNLDKNLTYHFLVKHQNFRKFGYSEDDFEPSMNLLNQEQNKFKNINYEKKYYFSCLDELLVSLDALNNDNILQKKLTFGGYHVIINNTCCVLRTDIYKYIDKIMPTNKNQYINYLELYQKNLLSDILCFIHKYPNDVIRRINISIKILSKEILNIYHLTRKKQNSNLYECLEPIYKKILWDLHKIYSNNKINEKNYEQDIFIEKISITIDIVHDYIKKMHVIELLQLFDDRQKIIGKLDNIKYDYTNILSINNINIIAQIKLMNI